MKSVLGWVVFLAFAFSNAAQADPAKIKTLNDGSKALILSGGGFPVFYFYRWFRYATQKTADDNRSQLLKGRGFYLNSYPTPKDEMSFDYTVKFVFDGKDNQIRVENNRITFQGSFAYLLAQGALIDNAISGGVTIKKGTYFGDFQVIPQYANLMCERVTLPLPGSNLVQSISRCILDI